MKKISVVTPCYNEQDNIMDLYNYIKKIFSQLNQYQYEHIFIDNASTDHTITILKNIAKKDNRIKIIINSRNFGYIRSSFYGLTQANGDAVVLLAADLQDPPELIPSFLEKWESGYKIVAGVKITSDETFFMSLLRKAYYNFITKISDTPLIKNFMGFGLYDSKIIKLLRSVEDPYPYFRGLISEMGFDVAKIFYHQPLRKRGITKNNFFTLYDLAMTGITKHSKIPLRIATMGGIFLFMTSCVIAIVYFSLKIFFWNHFPLKMSALTIGLFFFSSLQLVFIGLLGEYILSIHAQVQRRPLVIAVEKINFDCDIQREEIPIL